MVSQKKKISHDGRSGPRGTYDEQRNADKLSHKGPHFAKAINLGRPADQMNGAHTDTAYETGMQNRILAPTSNRASSYFFPCFHLFDGGLWMNWKQWLSIYSVKKPQEGSFYRNPCRIFPNGSHFFFSKSRVIR